MQQSTCSIGGGAAVVAIPRGSSKAMSGVAVPLLHASTRLIVCLFFRWNGTTAVVIFLHPSHMTINMCGGVLALPMPWPFCRVFYAAALLFVLRHCALCRNWATAFCFAALFTAALRDVLQCFFFMRFFLPRHWHLSCLGIGDCVASCCGIGNCVPWHWLLRFASCCSIATFWSTATPANFRKRKRCNRGHVFLHW